MTWLQVLLPLILFAFGVIAYRWQKAVDRETDLLRERRGKYDVYIESRNSAFDLFMRMDEHTAGEAPVAYFTARDCVSICCSEEVSSHLERHAKTLLDFWHGNKRLVRDDPGLTVGEFRGLVNDEAHAFADLMIAMRKETINSSSFNPDFRSFRWLKLGSEKE